LENAIWLVLALPRWYGWPVLVLAAGLLAAVLGLAIAGTISPKFRRFWPGNRGLLLFILPFVASEILVFIAGALRGKLLRGEMANISRSELALQEELTQRKLNHTLERSPADFADFQTGFIQGTLGISDATKLQQIHELIRQTYEQAVANGLDIPSKPGTDEDAWVQRRFQLDRQATEAVKQFLTPEEQSSFDRAFLGLMGVDLGVGVDKSNYPKNFLGSE